MPEERILKPLSSEQSLPKASDDLISEAKKYKSAEEFVNSKADDYIKSTREYRDWAKGSKNIIEAYHGTPYSFDKFEIGKKQSGAYNVQGISFATKPELAEPFSRQYPDWYYDKLKNLRGKYEGISSIENKVKIIENGKRIRSVEAIKKEGKEIVDRVNKEWKEKGEWLYNGNYEKFKQKWDYSFSRIDELRNELKRAENYVKPTISKAEAVKLASYNKELQALACLS